MIITLVLSTVYRSRRAVAADTFSRHVYVDHLVLRQATAQAEHRARDERVLHAQRLGTTTTIVRTQKTHAAGLAIRERRDGSLLTLTLTVMARAHRAVSEANCLSCW